MKKWIFLGLGLTSILAILSVYVFSEHDETDLPSAPRLPNSGQNLVYPANRPTPAVQESAPSEITPPTQPVTASLTAEKREELQHWKAKQAILQEKHHKEMAALKNKQQNEQEIATNLSRQEQQALRNSQRQEKKALRRQQGEENKALKQSLNITPEEERAYFQEILTEKRRERAEQLQKPE